MILNEQIRLQVKPARTAKRFGIFEYAEPLTPELARVYAQQSLEAAASKPASTEQTDAKS